MAPSGGGILRRLEPGWKVWGVWERESGRSGRGAWVLREDVLHSARAPSGRGRRIFDQKIGDFAFKVVLLEGVVSKLVAPLFEQNCAPVQDILKFLGSAHFLKIQKLRARGRQFDLFDVLIVFIISSKIGSRAEHPRNFIGLSSSK